MFHLERRKQTSRLGGRQSKRGSLEKVGTLSGQENKGILHKVKVEVAKTKPSVFEDLDGRLDTKEKKVIC